MLTEKRFAKDGERIITTYSENYLSEEDRIFGVTHEFPDGGIYVNGLTFMLQPDQYEVIVGEETEE